MNRKTDTPMFRRYAVFFTPDGSFAERGSAWLGWDNATGTRKTHPAVGVDLEALTRRPRKYGIHATLKPPFFLAAGKTTESLMQAVEKLANRLSPARLNAMKVSRMGRFLALVPDAPIADVQALAADLVRELDSFRAPPSPEELARRRQRPLSLRHEENLRNWGYPYVLEDFRFHITLTGPSDRAAEICPIAQTYFDPVVPAPLIIDTITLLGQQEDDNFVQIRRFPLNGKS